MTSLVLLADAAALPLADASVDAIVTSPEYADQRKYAHGAKTPPADYAAGFAPYLDEMRRVLRPTGSLMLNLGVILRDGEETTYADDLLTVARYMGWKLLHRMIWHKSNPLPMSHPPYLTIAHEWVFWLALRTDAYRGYDADTRRPTPRALWAASASPTRWVIGRSTPSGRLHTHSTLTGRSHRRCSPAPSGRPAAFAIPPRCRWLWRSNW